MSDNDPNILRSQSVRLNKALKITREQVRLAIQICNEENIDPGDGNLVALMQVLATNYLAEVHKAKTG